MFFFYKIYFGSTIQWKNEICKPPKRIFYKNKKGSIVVENEYQNKIVSRGQEYPILFNKLHLNSKFKLSQVIFNIFI